MLKKLLHLGDIMKIMRYFYLCLFFFSLPTGLFSEHYQDENEQLAIQTIYLTHGIISQAPELIKWQDGDKIYLDERRIKKKNRGGYVCLNNETEVYLPTIFSDEQGIFTSTSKDFLKKPFIFICNECNFKWDGGVFTMRCPECRSKDISNIPNG